MMWPPFRLSASLLLHLLPLLPWQIGAQESTSTSSKRWAASGGGWKAMFANVGVANLLQQADLLSEVDSVATNSGATWFSLQFFFSEPFYQAVTGDSSALSDFVTEWMGAYKSIFSRETYDCPSTPAPWNDFCSLVTDFGGSWGDFTTSMLGAAAKSYGDDSFVSRTLLQSNVVSDLRDKVLHVQTSLAPNALLRNESSISYLGSSNATFSCPIAAQFEVTNATGGGFIFALPSLPFLASGPAPDPFLLANFSQFGLASATAASDLSLLVTPPGGSAVVDANVMKYPFGTMANVAQIAAASSAALAILSPLVPSVYAQLVSGAALNPPTGSTSEQTVAYFESVAADPTGDGLAVCSQYPQACGPSDLYLIDGVYTDDPSIAMDLGNYLTTNGAALVDGATIKYVLVNADGASQSLLSYFSTSFNADVSPGDVVWSPTLGQTLPWRSPQLFEDSLDLETLLGNAEPVDGLEYVSTTILTGTTLDNPAFGVSAGHTVELLVVNVLHNITTGILTPTDVDLYTTPLAAMTVELASSSELLARLQDFFGSSAGPAPTPANPTATPPTPTGGGGGGGGAPTSNAVRRGSFWGLALGLTLLLHGRIGSW